MFKVRFLNSVLFLLIKYSVFFFIVAFMGGRFKTAVMDNASTSWEFFKLTLGYILYVLVYSIFLIALFCAPLYFILKIEKGFLFLLAAIVFYGIEFVVYTHFYSPSDRMLGIYNAIVGVVLLCVFFFTSIKHKFEK
ncbi:hypothetical protein SAMN06265350_102458 [Solitalea koreensis]|uniref:Uncharacterized protein n=1 Tax=Solitalea koreensis TaxID=543615 RepID=A0A521BQN6_9SPHI|nr:hypothetical protein SAMN06265350_102458 [Solitalea koreensis]